MATREHLRSVLTDRFAPTHLEVLDDSDKHAGHSGSRPEGGSHFTVIVVSSAFEGRGLVDRHRMVNDVFADELRSGDIHALALTTRTPDEWSQRRS